MGKYVINIIFGVIWIVLFVNPSEQYKRAATASGSNKGLTKLPKFNEALEAASPNYPECETPDMRAGLCRPVVHCTLFYIDNQDYFGRGVCQINGEQNGICCPLAKTEVPWSNISIADVPTLEQFSILVTPSPPDIPIPQISAKQLHEIAEMSIKTLQQRQDKIHDIIVNKNITVSKNSPAFLHQMFSAPTNEALELGEKAQLAIEATKNAMKMLKLTPQQGTFALPKFSLRGTIAERACPPESECDPGYPYRTMDGSCNNPNNPDLGKVLTGLNRILAPEYADGIDSPRMQNNGEPLPSARLVSQRFVLDENRPYKNLTLITMQWGQFVDHDIARTPLSRSVRPPACCTEDGQELENDLKHPDCFPISVPEDDPFYREWSQTCMALVRSLAAPNLECNLGPRTQSNQVTHFLDGSVVYGSFESAMIGIREGVGGRLSSQNYGGREYMPRNPDECTDETEERFCFRGGDGRLNEQVHLALLHTVWFREHNRIANKLQELNPHWDDETIFQESRRIVGAMIQHITYNEFLPVIMGSDNIRKFQLQTTQSGYTRFYDPNINPSVTNAFSAAAYRFGHSMIQGIIKMISRFGAVREVDLYTTHTKPYSIYDNFPDLVRGLTSQESQRNDRYAAQSITNHLFQRENNDYGLDLIAINIQRGRDHGIPPYNEWRKVCGLSRIVSWDEFATVSDKQAAESLRELYPNIDELDLFVGGIAETALPGAVLGPTFMCIVADQFIRLRIGDRFFYEEVTSGFTEAQLEQIRNVSLARVCCDNSENFAIVQPIVFLKSGMGNNQILCSSTAIPQMDFTPWKESN